MPGQTRLPLNVLVEVSDEKLVFTRDDKELGRWPLDEVVVDLRSDGFHLNLGNEQVILSVSDSAGFVGAIAAASRRRHALDGGGEPVRSGSESEQRKRGLSTRLEAINPEEQLTDIKQRIYEIRAAITDDAVSPPEVFRRWLRLLKELNVRHGQGAIPTAVFYRLNTELLDLLPVPANSPPATTGSEFIGLRG